LTYKYKCVKISCNKIEAHLTKSIPPREPPRLWKKGVGAEADAVAGISAGSTENIRGAVAFLCEGLSSISVLALFWRWL